MLIEDCIQMLMACKYAFDATLGKDETDDA
jgi:hypothetical protein